jgi:hypothetical protein
LRLQSPDIEVEDSLTGFVKRIGLDPKGRNMRLIKDQLARLSAAQIRMAFAHAEDHSSQVNAHIVGGFDLWFAKDERQRVLWPSTVRLSLDYFESLQRHAVPLDERAIAALSHNAMALDVYAWLAQRLHRVDPGRPAFVAWTAVKDQFGVGYHRWSTPRPRSDGGRRATSRSTPTTAIGKWRDRTGLLNRGRPLLEAGLNCHGHQD